MKLNDLKDSLTEKEEYNKEVCEQELEELEWRKANLLVALEKTMEARECLKRIVAGEGLYMLQAQMLLNRLNLK